MLKCKAFILFLGLVLYAAEFIALPASIGAVPAKNMCCGNKTIKTAHRSCAKQQQPCDKQQKDCNTAGCLNCPLCYVVTMPAAVLPEKPCGTIKTEYSLFRSHYLFIYYSTAWKPPNGC